MTPRPGDDDRDRKGAGRDGGVAGEGDDLRVCGVCGRTLDHHFGLGWAHTITDAAHADHDPVPVRPSETTWRGRCDFCMTDEPTWVFPVSDFQVGDLGSVGNWAACEPCKRLAASRHWAALAIRVAQVSGHSPVMRRGLTKLYRLVGEHVTGPAYPLEPDER